MCSMILNIATISAIVKSKKPVVLSAIHDLERLGVNRPLDNKIGFEMLTAVFA